MKAAVFGSTQVTQTLPRQTSKHHLVIRSKLPTCAAATVNLADALIGDAMLPVVLPERNVEVCYCSVGGDGGLGAVANAQSRVAC
jgi:hypothetical protein